MIVDFNLYQRYLLVFNFYFNESFLCVGAIANVKQLALACGLH